MAPDGWLAGVGEGDGICRWPLCLPPGGLPVRSITPRFECVFTMVVFSLDLFCGAEGLERKVMMIGAFVLVDRERRKETTQERGKRENLEEGREEVGQLGM